MLMNGKIMFDPSIQNATADRAHETELEIDLVGLSLLP